MRFLSPLLATLLTPLVATLPMLGQEVVPAPAGASQSLQVRVITAEGAARAEAGAQSSAPITVEVKDASGAPVAEAAVIFRLPESGPSGTFGGGTLTSVVYTDAAGRASAGSVHWGTTSGVAPVRITVAKGTGHAGLLFSETLTGSSGATPAIPQPASPGLQVEKIPVSTPVAHPVQAQPRPGTLAASNPNSPSVTIEHLGARPARSRRPQPVDDDDEAQQPQPGSTQASASSSGAYADDGSPDANVPIRHALPNQDAGESLDSAGVSVTRAGAGEQSVGNGHHLKRWLVIAGVIAGAGAGFALVHKQSGTSASSGTSIGAPSISVGHP